LNECFTREWEWHAHPPSDRVHLWMCDADEVRESALLDAYAEVLDEEEQQRLRRLHFADDRHCFLVSHAFLRHVLTLYANEPAAAWQFVPGAHGKPALNLRQSLFAPAFNLSHSGNTVLVGIACGGIPLGVDIECQRAGRRIDELARRKFAPAEWDGMSALQGESREQRFYRLWTLKEAYIKARGEGLALPLREFAFAHEKPEDFRFSTDAALADDPARWSFWSYQRPGVWSAAVAWRAQSPAIADPVCMRGVALRGWSPCVLEHIARNLRNTANCA
jgi:4'-phosphopantetheinyl transferase